MSTTYEYYPPIEPYHTEYLKVSDRHTIYTECVGNPKGQPIVFLHGGPGGGINPDHRRFFDPNFYNVILFDQRGCGQSKPHADLNENTTWDLVEDIEKIRSHYKIKSWMIFGGSWGSTLALSYAITHPQNVTSLILRGIFLCRPSELKWFYQEGASQIFPDYWESYFNHIPNSERTDFIKAYYKRLTDSDSTVRLNAAKIWSQWEAATSRLVPSQDAINDFENPDLALAFARIECHYFINNAFFKTDNYLLENIDKIKNIPGTIIQGRYDIVCPAKSAWELHKAWPKSKLNIIADAGHAAGELGIRSALIATCEEFKK